MRGVAALPGLICQLCRRYWSWRRGASTGELLSGSRYPVHAEGRAPPRCAHPGEARVRP